jgi:hypothetical protein
MTGRQDAEVKALFRIERGLSPETGRQTDGDRSGVQFAGRIPSLAGDADRKSRIRDVSIEILPLKNLVLCSMLRTRLIVNQNG